MGILDEVMERKRHVESLIFVTADEALAQRAEARGIRTIRLHTLRKARGDPGELLRSLAQYTEVEIYVGGERAAEIARNDIHTVEVKVQRDQYNHPQLVQELQLHVRGKRPRS